ncbi:MAG: hypothetical protein ACFFDW_04090 [Candidatus Thorarchaeota archaeon]
MNLEEIEEKKQERRKNFLSAGKAIGVGIIEAGICGGLSFLLILIHELAVFGVLAIWLILGWFSTYLIKIRTLEIASTMLSIAVISFIIYFFGKISLWFIPLIIGTAMLFWIISFITKLFVFTSKQEQKEELTEIK